MSPAGKARRQRLIAEALGYSAEVQAPNGQPATEYVTDRWGQATRARLLEVVEGEVAAARAAGYADGYHAALQAARAAVREAVREAAEDASTVLLDAAPPLHPTDAP